MNEDVFAYSLALAESSDSIALSDLKFINETWSDIQSQVSKDRHEGYQSRILGLISKVKNG